MKHSFVRVWPIKAVLWVGARVFKPKHTNMIDVERHKEDGRVEIWLDLNTGHCLHLDARTARCLADNILAQLGDDGQYKTRNQHSPGAIDKTEEAT